MPEIEVFPIFKDGKRRATLSIIYDNSGWKVYVMYINSKKGDILASGTELLGKESALQIGLKMSGDWRDEETKAGRF
jgi:hypothetical protein